MPLDDIVFVFDGSNTLLARYLHGPGIDQVLAADIAGDVLWALADHQGTIRDLANFDPATGTTSNVAHRRYDSFGNITSATGTWTGFVYAYAGYVLEAEVDLHYVRMRWYDAANGKWISEDPIGFAAGDANLTRYVGNGVTNATDPSGLDEVYEGSGSNNDSIYWEVETDGFLYDPDEGAWKVGTKDPFDNSIVKVADYLGGGYVLLSDLEELARTRWLDMHDRLSDDFEKAKLRKFLDEIRFFKPAGDERPIEYRLGRIERSGDIPTALSAGCYRGDVSQIQAFAMVPAVVANMARWVAGEAVKTAATVGVAGKVTSAVVKGGALLVKVGTTTIRFTKKFIQRAFGNNAKVTDADLKKIASDINRTARPPIAKRLRFSTRKEAYEAAKRAGRGNEPVNHPHGEHGPHFHPGDGKGRPLNHDHYYYPHHAR